MKVMKRCPDDAQPTFWNCDLSVYSFYLCTLSSSIHLIQDWGCGRAAAGLPIGSDQQGPIRPQAVITDLRELLVFTEWVLSRL